MTFAGLAAWQGWLLLAGAAAVAIWLFLLKVRPPRVIVASLLLWGRVLSESRELTFWERIRRAVSLVLTAAIALALALAFARPTVARGHAPSMSGRILVVLDSSLSMRARTRSGDTRWARAIADARRLAVSAAGAVAVATTAEGLIEGPTSDVAIIDAALDRIAPSAAPVSGWPQLAGAEAVYFITDGAIARPLAPDIQVHSVYEAAANAGIVAFRVRPSLDRGAAGEAYLEVANFGSAQKVRLRLSRASTSLLDRTVEMAAGESLRQVVRLGHGAEREVRARIDAAADALDVDNEAVASIDRARALTVTIVGAQTTWLAPLFADNPDVNAKFVLPADYQPGVEDAIVFDRWTPRDAPARPALYFAPPVDAAWLAGSGATPPGAAASEKQPQWTIAGDHPVVAGVDPLTLTIERAHAYGAPQLVPVARSARGTPLIYVTDIPARPRAVIVAFGPAESNLASAPGFPVLVANALDWLAPADARRTLGPAGNPDVSNLGRTTAWTSRGSAMVGTGGTGRPWWVYCAAAAFAAALAEWWTWLRRITV